MNEEARREFMSPILEVPNPHLLSYDFYKHMTSLSVLTLGGVLTLSGSVFAANREPKRLLLSMVMIAASGIIAFLGQVEVVDWANRGGGSQKLLVRRGRGLVALTYGVGVGSFLSTVQSMLN